MTANTPAGDGRRRDDSVTPAEELEAWLAARGYAPGEADPPDATMSVAGRRAVEAYLDEMRRDRAVLDPAELEAAFGDADGDPFAAADALCVDAAVVLRSLARLSEARIGPVGLVVCDAAGAVLFRRPLPGFAMPRSAAPCALWPVYQALLSPGHPRRDLVRQAGHDARPMVAWSIAHVARPAGIRGPLTARATMLLFPASAGEDVQPTLGPTCRLCPLADCLARREASVP